MRTTKEIYFDLNDLGNTFIIKGIQFNNANDTGVFCDVSVEITDAKIRKDFNIPTEGVVVSLDLESHDEDGITGLLFVMNTVDSLDVDEEFNRDGFTPEFTLENVDTSESIPYVHLNRNLQRVIETYATSQFLFNLGMRPCCFDFQNTNRVSMTTTEDLLYIRKYLLQNNYDKLVGDKEIIGSDIDYPVR